MVLSFRGADLLGPILLVIIQQHSTLALGCKSEMLSGETGRRRATQLHNDGPRWLRVFKLLSPLYDFPLPLLLTSRTTPLCCVSETSSNSQCPLLLLSLWLGGKSAREDFRKSTLIPACELFQEAWASVRAFEDISVRTWRPLLFTSWASSRARHLTLGRNATWREKVFPC